MIWSIRDRNTFGALRKRGTRIKRGPLTVTYLPGDAHDPPRVAYSIGRHVGGAVVRNRLRRRAQSCVRELDRNGAIHPGSYLMSAGAAAPSLEAGQLCDLLGAAFGSVPSEC